MRAAQSQGQPSSWPERSRCPGRHQRERLGNLAGCTVYCVEPTMSAEQQVTDADAAEAEVALVGAEQDRASGSLEPVISKRFGAKRDSSKKVKASALDNPRVREVEDEIQLLQDKLKK